jgi:hypothetical protein
MRSHIGGMSPGTDEGDDDQDSKSDERERQGHVAMAAPGGRSFWARARTAITDSR